MPVTKAAGTNTAVLLRGTVVSPDEVFCDGSVLYDKSTGVILCTEANNRMGVN